MSKVECKYKNWCSKEQKDYLLNYPKLLSSEIQFYKLSKEIKVSTSIRKDDSHITNSIKMFDKYSKEKGHEYTFLHKIKKSLLPIKKYDIAFVFRGEKYLYHTYKILGFIREAVNAYILSNDSKFIQGTIADYKRENDFYLSQYNKYKKRYMESHSTFRGSDFLNSFLYRSLYLRKEFTKYFLSYFAIIGVDNIKQLDNDLLESRLFKNTLKVFMSGKVNKKDCAKSLLSVLYYYFRFTMHINKNQALYIAKDLVEKVFGIYYEYKGSEILKNVYVKEVLGTHVVYSFDTKRDLITIDNKNYLENVLAGAVKDITKFPKQLIKPSLDNPLRIYSSITPSELLQKI